MSDLRVALIQMHSSDSKPQNVERALLLIRAAIRRQARLICLPEVFNYRGPLDNGLLDREVAEDIPGFSTRPLIEECRRHKIFMLCGSVYERSRGDSRAYNTSLFVGPRGEIRGTYRKRNLFDARLGNKRVQESKYFKAGKKPVTVQAGPFRLGLTICYDLRFPMLYQQYAAQGCQVLAVPAAFTKQTGRAHWELLLRTRAIENFCYMLAPNQVGKDFRGVEAYGHSMIVGPWGEVVARARGEGEQIVYGDLKMEAIRKARRILGKK